MHVDDFENYKKAVCRNFSFSVGLSSTENEFFFEPSTFRNSAIVYINPVFSLHVLYFWKKEDIAFSGLRFIVGLPHTHTGNLAIFLDTRSAILYLFALVF